ncbi:MAG: hypothetical protein IPM54_41010 [Polyangiaceae bacterium]|nr:hypothetical protein [Polyangiaceae bacterium]
MTTTWTWDTAPNGIGRLHMLESPDGIKTYAYSGARAARRDDALRCGRIVYGANDVRRGWEGQSARISAGARALPFGVTYEHDNHGHRIGVRDTYTNRAYWQLTDVDQAGRYKGELLAMA